MSDLEKVYQLFESGLKLAIMDVTIRSIPTVSTLDRSMLVGRFSFNQAWPRLFARPASAK